METIVDKKQEKIYQDLSMLHLLSNQVLTSTYLVNLICCGGCRIRTCGALITPDGFQDRYINPLCQTSIISFVDLSLYNTQVEYLYK